MSFTYAVKLPTVVRSIIGYLAVVSVFAQTVSIRGIVRGQDGKPVGGAVVHAAGANVAGRGPQAVTASNGIYSLSVPAGDAVTVCAQKLDGYSSCLFEPRHVDLGQRIIVAAQDIVLRRAAKLEVVVSLFQLTCGSVHRSIGSVSWHRNRKILFQTGEP